MDYYAIKAHTLPIEKGSATQSDPFQMIVIHVKPK